MTPNSCILDEDDCMNVVSIMAHQDDEMRCLGTMLKCRARGDRLFFVTLTDGCHGIIQPPNLTREEAGRIRFREMSAVAEKAGAEYISLAAEDEFLYDTADMRLRLVETIRKTGADLIFTHYHDDYNLDHSTTFQLTRQGAMLASLAVLPTASPPLGRHPAVFLVEPHGPIPFQPSYFVDITAFADQKIAILKQHESQERAMQLALGAGFEALCRRPDAYWGEKAGCAYAECFAPMPARGAIKPYPVLP